MRLLERDAEKAAVADAVTAACAGTGSLLVVDGPPGIGKTALLEHARQVAAKEGLRVLVARAGPLEREIPHGVARQLLESTVLAAGEAEREQLLAGSAALARPVVLPDGVDGLDAPADRRAPVMHGLYWLTANLAAAAPLLLAVDDAQWSDAASLRYLAYLARRLDGVPVVVLATVRSGEAATEETALVELFTGPFSRVLRPAPLSEPAVDEMVRDALPVTLTPGFAPACRAATGGVPFLLEALLAALSASGATPSPAAVNTVTSQTVAHATLLRVSRLAADGLPVARGVAVLGRHATLRRVARLTGCAEADVLRSCDALAAGHILRHGQPLGFVHPIVMASIYDELPAGERSLLHARAAELLAADGEPDEEVAAHLLVTQPGTSEGALATLRSAARTALAGGAPESAIAYLRRCLAEPPPAAERAAVQLELGRAEAVVRDPQAVPDLERALDLAVGPVERARVAVQLVAAAMFGGRWRVALDHVDHGLAGLGEADPELALRLEVFRAGMMANDPDLVDDFERDLPRLRTLARGDEPAARLMAALLASCAVCRGDPAREVDALATHGLDGNRLMAGEDADAWGPQAAASLAYVGEFDRALVAAEAMRTGARSRGSVYGFVRAAGLRALVEGLRGDLRAVEAEVRSAFELARDNELMFSAPPLLRWSVDALLERPELDDVAGAAEDIALDPGLAASFSGAWLLETRGRLRLARGDASAARADLQRCGETMTRLHFRNPMVTAWRSALALAQPESERAEARRLALEELELARMTGLRRPQGVALRTLALLEDGSARIAALDEAAAVLDDAEAPLELARTLVALGTTHRRLGQRRAADAALRAGLDLAHRCGAERLAARAEEELRAIGARPRRRASSGFESLTPSEARVARQAASGMTNREIAQALFVTSKTVENQLSRVYLKLGVRGRDQLPEVVPPR